MIIDINTKVEQLREVAKSLEGIEILLPSSIPQGEHNVGKLLYYIADMLEE